MDMPLVAEEISLKELRKIHRELVAAQGCSVEIIFMCNKKELRAVEKLPNYLERDRWSDCAKIFYSAKDVGACEVFRFRPHAL